MTWAGKTVFFLICGCIVLSTLAYGTVHQPTLALFYIVVAIMVILWAIDGLNGRALRLSKSPLQIPVYAAAIYALIQTIPFGSVAEIAGVASVPRTISASPFDTEVTALHFIALAFFLSLTLVYLDTAARLRRLVNVITVFGFVFAFFAILQAVLSPTRIYGVLERAAPFGSFVNRHHFAAYMEMTMAVPLGMLFAGAVPRDKKLLCITAVALMGVALLLSGSRGGFIAMLAEILMFVILTTRTRGAKAIALKAALAVLLVGGVIAGSIFVGGESSLSRFVETANSQDITTDRTHIWGVTLKVIQANLPLGAGLGAFGQAYTPFDDFTGLERVEQAHDDYLQVLADAGIVGAAIGGLFLFLLIREGRRNVRVKNTFRRGVAIGAVSGIFAVMVHSIFDFVLHTTAVSLLFLTLIAMLVASAREFPDDEPDPEGTRSHRRSMGSISSFIQKRG